MNNVVIEGFELLEKLGEGGMGAVFKARQKSLDRLVAVKILPRHVVSDADSVERFLIEAKIAAALKHNNIIQVYEAGKSGEDYFFAMELVSGYTVVSWLERKGRLQETDALLVAETIADALAYAWEQAWVVHGDIKPANIMVDSDGTIKLADFLALTPPDGGERPESLRENVVGTPNYMSPEQACGNGKLDFRTDIYSLGAVLYHLVTGHMPFEEDSDPREIMRRQITDFIPDPQALNPELSVGCAWLIEKMMVKQSAHRYLNWRDVQADIRKVRHGEMPFAPFPDTGASTVSRAEKRLLPTKNPAAPEPSAEQAAPPPPDTEKRRPRPRLAVLILLLITAMSLWVWSRFENVLIHDEGATPHATVSLPPETSLPPPPATPEPLSIIPATAPEPVVPDVGKPTQTAVPPATEPLKEKSPSPDQEKAILDYTRVFQRLVPLLRNRQLDAAQTVLNTCLVNAPSESFRRFAEKDAKRLQEILALEALIVQNRSALKGAPVLAYPNISGTLADAAEGSITIARTTENGRSAMISVPIDHVQSDSLRGLILTAASNDASRCKTIWALGDFQFQVADELLGTLHGHPDREMLMAWREDWARLLNLARASELLDRITLEINRENWMEARRMANHAEARYAESEMLSRLRSAEWDAIRERLRSEEEKETARLVLPQDELTPAAAEEPALPAGSVPPDDAENDDGSGALDIQDIKERFIALDGQVVRLRFRCRQDIRQVDKDTYATELGSEYGQISAVFSQDALRWVRKIPQGNQGRQRRQVFVKVDAAGNRVVLSGRKKNRPGSAGGEYTW